MDATLTPSHRIPLGEWASLHSHLLWIYDGRVDPAGRATRGVFSNHHAAWYLRQGEVEVSLGKKVWKARAGEWIFPPQGERVQVFSEDSRILSVRFRAVWPTGEDFFKEGLGLNVSGDEYPGLMRTALPLVRFVAKAFPSTTTDLMRAPASHAVNFRLQTLFAHWFEEAVKVLTSEGLLPSRMGTIDPRLLAAVRTLDCQPLNKPIAEALLASRVGLSVSQLNRLFLRQFGLSSKGYFERRRYEHARAALEGTPHAVKEIAYEVGFSLPHFSAWFTRRHGLSPRAFRTIARSSPKVGPTTGGKNAQHLDR